MRRCADTILSGFSVVVTGDLFEDLLRSEVPPTTEATFKTRVPSLD